jgi:hypothetical protein
MLIIKPTKGAKMKHRLYLLALIALLLALPACALPWTPAEDTPTPSDIEEIIETEPDPTDSAEIIETDVATEEPIEEPTEIPFTCGLGMAPASAFALEFCYPEQYTNGFMQVQVPENPPSDDVPPWGVIPNMIELTLTGYPVENQYHDPIVRIYPVADFVALDPHIQTIVDDLQALLASQDPNPASIPFVPIFNAAQMMQAQVTYLDFRNGKGVRFITQYGQAALLINNDSAFYAFIGITDDGAYLVSATMPITHPLFFPDMLTEPAEGWQTFAENLETYLSKKETDLLTQPADSFFPHLTPLDEMMASFLIPPDAIP